MRRLRGTSALTGALVFMLAAALTSCGSTAAAPGRAEPEADADVPRDREDDAEVGQHRLDWQAVPLRPEHRKHGLGCAAGRTASSYSSRRCQDWWRRPAASSRPAGTVSRPARSSATRRTTRSMRSAQTARRRPCSRPSPRPTRLRRTGRWHSTASAASATGCSRRPGARAALKPAGGLVYTIDRSRPRAAGRQLRRAGGRRRARDRTASIRFGRRGRAPHGRRRPAAAAPSSRWTPAGGRERSRPSRMVRIRSPRSRSSRAAPGELALLLRASTSTTTRRATPTWRRRPRSPDTRAM